MDQYLTGQFLVAMPGTPDPRFDRAVIYICAHSEDGAMGIIVNKPMDEIAFQDILEQLDLRDAARPGIDLTVQFGGPVDVARGFVLHERGYAVEGTMPVDDAIGLTASVEVLRDIAAGGGPDRRLFALGYAGWGPGQLEEEIQENGWLHAPAKEAILFSGDLEAKWESAIVQLGIDPALLSDNAGRA